MSTPLGPNPFSTGPFNTPSAPKPKPKPKPKAKAKPAAPKPTPAKPAPRGGGPTTYRSADAESASRNKVPLPTQIMGTEYGTQLFDALDLPKEIEESVKRGENGEVLDSFVLSGSNQTGWVEMSVAAGLEWLVDVARSDKEQYNDLVTGLYEAGYLSKADVRYGAYSNQVAQAFVEATWDVSQVNKRGVGIDSARNSAGGYSLGEHLDTIIEANAEKGVGPGSDAAGDELAPLIREDQWTDPDSLKEQAHDAAKSVLGRKLTDDEEKAFLATFREKEQAWNDERWNAQTSVRNGATAVSTTSRPDESVAPQYVRDEFEQESAGQDMGSYMGVLRNMMGLGAAGIGGNVA